MQRVDFLSAPSNFFVQWFLNFDSKDLGLRDLGVQFSRSDRRNGRGSGVAAPEIGSSRQPAGSPPRAGGALPGLARSE